MQKYHFNVGGHTFMIETEEEITKLLPNLTPFVSKETADTLFNIRIDNTLTPAWSGNKIGTFPCPSATFEVYRLDNKAYRILVSNENNVPCAFIISDENHENFTITTRGGETEVVFGLNNSLMIIYTLCSAAHKTLMMHSSVVEKGGRAYMFLGASGRGKSTHSDLWTKNIEGSRLINDDNPIVRIASDGTPTVYGTPWSGKRPVYMNVNYPIGGIATIEQNKENRIERESVPMAFGTLLSSCSTFKFDKKVHLGICETISNILEHLPVYTLYCRPDAEAATLSSNTFGA